MVRLEAFGAKCKVDVIDVENCGLNRRGSMCIRRAGAKRSTR